MRAAATLTVLIACLLGGCGSGASTARSQVPVRSATLILDFTPNAVHAGVYAALARHYDRAEGVQLHVIAPTASTDSVKLLETGRADFAILDIHDLAIAREKNPTHPPPTADIVGIMAIVQRPLSAVIAAPDIPSPRALPGKTVGITGVPSDTAVLRSVVAGSGGDPAKVKTVTIGFDAVADLLAGRVAAATAFWNDEGQAIQSRRPGFHIFRVDEFGAPSYPELVLVATRPTIQRNPSLTREVVDALVNGYRFTLAHPSSSAKDLEQLVPGLDPKLVAVQLDGLLPAFRDADGRIGVLDLATLRAWADWEAHFGIVTRRPDVAQAFDPSFAANVPGPASAADVGDAPRHAD
jgi:ABC-type nitrate/sulfonate/bicarbonate transport system substrate-binding protein